MHSLQYLLVGVELLSEVGLIVAQPLTKVDLVLVFYVLALLKENGIFANERLLKRVEAFC